jgi:hypothetical protein
MTTPETIESHYSPALVHLGDDELLAEMENIRAILDGIKTTLGRLEMEVFHRMEERGATAIPSETYICELETVTKYDQPSFTPLKELFNDADLKRCLRPAHIEEVEVADKWTTATVKSLATKYGGDALRIVKNARMDSRGRLKFTRRDT